MIHNHFFGGHPARLEGVDWKVDVNNLQHLLLHTVLPVSLASKKFLTVGFRTLVAAPARGAPAADGAQEDRRIIRGGLRHSGRPGPRVAPALYLDRRHLVQNRDGWRFDAGVVVSGERFHQRSVRDPGMLLDDYLGDISLAEASRKPRGDLV